jgi:hypothetical protein
MAAYCEHWLTHSRRLSSNSLQRRRIIGMAFIAYLLTDGFISFGKEKVYLTQSTAWLKQSINKTCIISSNNTKIAYLSGHTIDWESTEQWSSLPNSYPDSIFNKSDILVREYRHKWTMPKNSLPSDAIILKRFEDAEKNGVEIIQIGADKICGGAL